MLRNKIILLFILLAFSSCVKIYSPKIEGADLNKYVVSGQITLGEDTQTVNVSLTSSINKPTYIPLLGCTVHILDNKDNTFPLVDMGNGDYSTMIDPKYMVPGKAFKVVVIVPDGDSIVSDYDTLSVVPPVDSIYYLRKDIVSPVPYQSKVGIQFYLDFKGANSDSRYYKWNVYETWEYHAEYPLEYYYDGTVHHIFPPDYSKFTCWDTRKIPEVFTLSTENLSQNVYNNIPLQYVDNKTPKLANGYSMLVEQLALSKEAYDYWDQLRINSTQQGGLYEKQPIVIKGNLRDITHPDKEVLGFFGAASASFKRIFISQVPGLTLNYVIPCTTIVLKRGYIMIPPSAYPAALMASQNGPLPIWLSQICVNCLLQGGTNVKPSFWPN
ncbi:MAG: DUF4249 domain-containing protein [Bacteroidales bacterium]|nr:DUF4249 domain-containing protein [Bacteroidales bacterium]